MKNSLLGMVNKSLEEKGFFPEKCIWEFDNGFEVTEEIGFGNSYMIGYVSDEKVSLTYIDIDCGDHIFHGVISNEQALQIINKCLDNIVWDSESYDTDNVVCTFCSFDGEVKKGQEVCPVCSMTGVLSWHEDKPQETSI